jgi:hypothetical protein
MTPRQRRRWLRDLATGPQGVECVDWPWSSNQKGYGVLGQQRATHLVLEYASRDRPAPPRDQALHSCDRPICVAPWHLRWGTQAENTQEARDRGLLVAARGERIATGVLTAPTVLEIRAAYAAGGVSQRQLAIRFGVSQASIHSIVTRKAWRHLEDGITTHG